MDMDGRVKALVSGAGSGRSQGLKTALALDHPMALQLPGQAGPHAGLAGLPCVLAVALEEGPVFTASRQVALCPWSSASHCPFSSPTPPQAMLMLYQPAKGHCPASHWPEPLATWHQRKGVCGYSFWHLPLCQLLELRSSPPPFPPSSAGRPIHLSLVQMSPPQRLLK